MPSASSPASSTRSRRAPGKSPTSRRSPPPFPVPSASATSCTSAVAISIGGPGATFWLIVAGFLAWHPSSVECTLGVKYRQENADGSVSGGPMFYLDRGLRERRLPRLGKAMAWYYAICIIVGCLGGRLHVPGQPGLRAVRQRHRRRRQRFRRSGWLFGLALAVFVRSSSSGGHQEHRQGDRAPGALHGTAVRKHGTRRDRRQLRRDSRGARRHRQPGLHAGRRHRRLLRGADPRLSARRLFQRGPASAPRPSPTRR